MTDRWLPLIVLGLSLTTAHASAQAPGSEAPVPAATASPARPVTDAPSRSTAQAAQPAANPSWIQAQQTLAQAQSFFDAGNYDAALQHFTQAYASLAGHPRRFAVLNNIAVCHERLFRYDKAVEYYERYLKEAPPETSDRAEVRRIVETLDTLLATVDIATNTPAQLWVDGRKRAAAPGTYRLAAGRRTLELQAEGRRDVRLELTLNAGEHRDLSVELQELSTYSGLSPTYFYLTVVLTGALAVGAGTLGVVFLDQRADARALSSASMGAPTAENRSNQRALERLRLAGDLTLVGALIAGATSIVLFLLTDFDEGESPKTVSLGLGRVALGGEL